MKATNVLTGKILKIENNTPIKGITKVPMLKIFKYFKATF